MSDFDVEREVKRLIRAQETVPGEWHLAIDDGHERGPHLWETAREDAELFAGHVQKAVALLLTRCRDATERRLLPDLDDLREFVAEDKERFAAWVDYQHERRRRREEG